VLRGHDQPDTSKGDTDGLRGEATLVRARLLAVADSATA